MRALPLRLTVAKVPRATPPSSARRRWIGLSYRPGIVHGLISGRIRDVDEAEFLRRAKEEQRQVDEVGAQPELGKGARREVAAIQRRATWPTLEPELFRTGEQDPASHSRFHGGHDHVLAAHSRGEELGFGEVVTIQVSKAIEQFDGHSELLRRALARVGVGSRACDWLAFTAESVPARQWRDRCHCGV